MISPLTAQQSLEIESRPTMYLWPDLVDSTVVCFGYHNNEVGGPPIWKAFELRLNEVELLFGAAFFYWVTQQPDFPVEITLTAGPALLVARP